jgi:hypothetical protein
MRQVNNPVRATLRSLLPGLPDRSVARTEAPGPSQVRKTCRHATHLGTCAICQRVQLERWRMQLTEVANAPRGSLPRAIC